MVLTSRKCMPWLKVYVEPKLQQWPVEGCAGKHPYEEQIFEGLKGQRQHPRTPLKATVSQRYAGVERLRQRESLWHGALMRTRVRGSRMRSRQKAPPGMRRIFSIHLGICTSLRCDSHSAYDMPAGASRSPASSTYLQHINEDLEQRPYFAFSLRGTSPSMAHFPKGIKSISGVDAPKHHRLRAVRCMGLDWLEQRGGMSIVILLKRKWRGLTYWS